VPTPLADLKIIVGVDQTGIPGALAKIESQVSQSGKRQAAALAGGGGYGGANRMNFAFQQASFGIQDFMQQLGPMGLQGALSASANNWSQVAAILSPVHGAVAGVAITLGSVLIPQLFKSSAAAKDTKEGVDALTESFKRQMQTLEDLSKIRLGDQGVGGIKDVKGAKKDLDEVNEKLDESKKKQADNADAMKKAEAKGLPEVLRALDIGAIRGMGFEFNKVSDIAKDMNGNKDPLAEAERIRNILRDVGLDTKTHSGEIVGERLIITRLRTAEQIKEIEKEIAEIRSRQGAEGVDQAALEKRKTALEARLPELKREAAEDLTNKLREEIAANPFNKYEKERRELNQKRRETLDEIIKTVPPGAERADLMRDVNMNFKSRILNVGKDDRASLTRDMQRDVMGDRASKIEDIAHTLEERGKKIDQLFPEGKERGMALSAAAAAAQAQRKALDTSGAGEKVGMGSALHDLIQKQLSDKDFTQETAKNTADANNKLDSLITAFNTRSIVAVAAP
jgi:hypothetical protein